MVFAPPPPPPPSPPPHALAVSLTHRLGLAYAGSAREDVIEVLTPVMWDANSSLEVRCIVLKKELQPLQSTATVLDLSELSSCCRLCVWVHSPVH